MLQILPTRIHTAIINPIVIERRPISVDLIIGRIIVAAIILLLFATYMCPNLPQMFLQILMKRRLLQILFVVVGLCVVLLYL